MPDLQPFPGIRYASNDLKDLICPPYDIISPTDQDRLYARSPHNAVRLELARGVGAARYSSAAETFAAWLRAGTLVADNPSLYVYRQDFVGPDGARRSVIGIIGALALEPFGETSGVLPHERTMPGPKEDRLALLRACPVNVSPIYAIYRGEGQLTPFFSSLEHRPTAARVIDDDSVLHRSWVISAPAEIQLLRTALRAGPLVIADGHHRYETALAYHTEKEGQPGGHGAIMCFCVDADAAEIVVLPYNRAFKTSVDPHELRERALARLDATTVDENDPTSAPTDGHAFTFVFPGGDVLVRLTFEQVENAVGPRAPAWRALDVVALHEVVLPALVPEGIDDFTFSKDPDEIRKLVANGWSAGVLLPAPTAAQIVDVARSGERMPQKASYFWPKAVTGLVFRALEETL